MKKIMKNIEEYICVACLSIMTLLTFVNVISRYVFSASLSFSEEITTYLFVLLTLVGAAIAAKRRAHLGFTIISDLVSAKVRRIMNLIGYFFSVVFCALLFYHGLLMTINQFERQQVTSGIQLPEWIFGAFIPIGSIFVLIRFAGLFIRTIKEKEGADKC